MEVIINLLQATPPPAKDGRSAFTQGGVLARSYLTLSSGPGSAHSTLTIFRRSTTITGYPPLPFLPSTPKRLLPFLGTTFGIWLHTLASRSLLQLPFSSRLSHWLHRHGMIEHTRLIESAISAHVVPSSPFLRSALLSLLHYGHLTFGFLLPVLQANQRCSTRPSPQTLLTLAPTPSIQFSACYLNSSPSNLSWAPLPLNLFSEHSPSS